MSKPLCDSVRIGVDRVKEDKMNTFHSFLDERMDLTTDIITHSNRYPEMWHIAPFRPEMQEFCPKCGSELRFMYGCGWDYDRKFCSNRGCGYEIEFETTTDVEDFLQVEG